MQALQPQIKEIQAKYKNDKQRMQQEMMRFYQENKVNPFASCIPLLAQLPVFITLFYVLRHDLREDICGQTAKTCSEFAAHRAFGRFFGESFLFIPDLTPRPTGGVLIALLVLYVGTQLISGLVMAVTADKSQRTMMLRPALHLRPLHHQLPGRPRPLLDHDQHLDDRPAVRDAEDDPAAGGADSRGGRGRQTPPPPPRKKKKRR